MDIFAFKTVCVYGMNFLYISYTNPSKTISLDVFCIELNVCNVIVKKKRNFDFDFSTRVAKEYD